MFCLDVAEIIETLLYRQDEVPLLLRASCVMLTNQGNFLNRCARAGTTDLMNSYPRLKAYYTRALARRHGSARLISTQIGSEWLSRTFLEALLADCLVSQRCRTMSLVGTKRTSRTILAISVTGVDRK
jgi:hypothetical protein